MSVSVGEDPELKAFMDVLRWIHQSAAKVRQASEKPGVAAARAWVEVHCPPVGDAFLSRALDPSRRQGDLNGGFIHGKRIYGDDAPWVIPALTCRWDFTSTPKDVQVFVVVTTVRDPADTATGPMSVAAWRYESGIPGSTHDVDHVQPSLSLRSGGTPLPGTHPPMSIRSPAFPLDSAGPVGIAFAVARSLKPRAFRPPPTPRQCIIRVRSQ